MFPKFVKTYLSKIRGKLMVLIQQDISDKNKGMLIKFPSSIAIVKFALILKLILIVFFTTGCIQEKIVIPVATVVGKVVVPPGKIPLGVKITVAGKPNIFAYVNEQGSYKLEFREAGKYLLIARSREFEVEFTWVDTKLEETTNAGTIYLNEKVVGEAKWLATIIDFPNATGFKVKSIDPQWPFKVLQMYDDGTNGDKIANDGIFTVKAQNLIPGSQLYSIVWLQDTDENEVKDPHQESERNGKSEIMIREPDMKLAKGKITSPFSNFNYSEVLILTAAGVRYVNADRDGSYAIAMEGSRREYLVFRSQNFHVRAIPVDLTTVTIYEVPTQILTPKAPGEVKLILIKSDFPNVNTPTVVADFTNWQPKAMYDDGTNGDDAAGDGIYTAVFKNVSPGYHKYAFNINQNTQVKDPYQESGDSQYSYILVK